MMVNNSDPNPEKSTGCMDRDRALSGMGDRAKRVVSSVVSARIWNFKSDPDPGQKGGIPFFEISPGH
jgi:hypothetical protein